VVDLIRLTMDVEMWQYRDEVKSAKITALESVIEVKSLSWYEKVGNSSAFKIVLFVAGVWIGSQAGGW
jgi:hypothetical protein